MKFFKKAYLEGRVNEELYLPHLIKEFGTLSHTTNKFEKFDFIGDNKYIELKTRTVEKDKYPDTMIGLNKIEYARLNSDKEFYFVFAFTDGLYYWKYNTDDQLNYRSGGRFDRGCKEIKQYAYIPINLLKNICINSI
jgi:hypothetical protein